MGFGESKVKKNRLRCSESLQTIQNSSKLSKYRQKGSNFFWGVSERGDAGGLVLRPIYAGGLVHRGAGESATPI